MAANPLTTSTSLFKTTYEFTTYGVYTITTEVGGNFAGTGGARTTQAALPDYISSITKDIDRNKTRLEILKNEVTKQNQILSLPANVANPNSPEAMDAKLTIASTQKEIARVTNTIKGQEAARADAQATGASKLAQVEAAYKAQLKAYETSTAANTTVSTSTTTTNGPTTSTTTKTTTTSANATTTTTKVTSSTTTKSSGNLTGAASDDSGATQPKTAGSTGTPKSPAAAAGAGGTTPSTATSTASSGSTKTGVADQGTNTSANSGKGTASPANAKGAPYTFQSSIISPQPVATASQPGKRLFNPLGEFSSYTYQITLYMVTPDAYAAFVATGRTRINALSEVAGTQASGGAFIIAQSGGINKSSSSRPPGFDFDYGIDNLVINQKITGPATGTPNSISEISFTINEPYGFSFLSNLRKAGDALAQYSSQLNQKSYPENALRQFFVLGIRFNGYDASGRPMQPNTKTADGSGVVDSLSQSGELFEQFFDININTIKFKIDGRMVNYQCKAVSTAIGKGFSITHGFIQTDKTVTADTVGVAIDKLITQLNTEQKNLAEGTPPSLTYPTQYEIIWLPGTEDILNASVVSPARKDKSQLPGSDAKSSKESNAAKEVNAQQANTNSKNITFSPQPIVQAINQIISQSSYLEDALSVIYTSNPEADPNTKSQPAVKPSYQKKKLSWYNCHPQITEIKWDPLIKDWSYKISYLIQKYETPVVDNPLVSSGKAYPGPHKRYDYWYTGENSEILAYEQVLDNSYFHTVVSAGPTTSAQAQNSGQPSATDPNKTSGANSQTPMAPNMQTSQPRQGSTGYGLEAQNSYLTSLYDPNSFAKAKITILGDPDFLASDPVYTEEQIYDQYYGSNGFSYNANGGQVFIEIDFKEAIDYTSQTGTMKINESILFWKGYPESIRKKVKGVSYKVTACISTFNNGAFKQVLECVINDFGDTSSADEIKAAEEFNQRNEEPANAAGTTNATGTNPGNADATSAQTTGTKTDQPVKTGGATGNAAPVTKTAAQGTTPTGPAGTQTANDDASSTNTQPAVPVKR